MATTTISRLITATIFVLVFFLYNIHYARSSDNKKVLSAKGRSVYQDDQEKLLHAYHASKTAEVNASVPKYLSETEVGVYTSEMETEYVQRRLDVLQTIENNTLIKYDPSLKIFVEPGDGSIIPNIFIILSFWKS